MARATAPADLTHLARLGAVVRLQQIDEEARAIRRMFPGLPKADEQREQPAAAPEAKPKKRKVTEAAREAARERMKAYWARRKGQDVPAPANGQDAETIEAADRPARKRAARGGGKKKSARKRTTSRKP